MSATVPLLEVVDLGVWFGGVQAVDDFSLSVPEGQVHGIIGANGAGKSTLFNVVSGAISPTRGEVRFKGQSLEGLRPDQICRLGIARTYQIVRPLGRLTVLENVMAGAYNRVRRVSDARMLALETLEFTGLLHRRDDLAANLTVNDRKRLEVTRALATQPEVLLLDEVMAGLNPTEVTAAVELLRRINTRGITMLIIEHVMRVVMSVSEVVTVMHHGKKLASGAPLKVAKDPSVVEAYFGSSNA